MFTKEAFPNFFRIVPSENAFNVPRIRLLQHFNWTRVGTIYQNEPRYALVSRNTLLWAIILILMSRLDHNFVINDMIYPLKHND